MGIFSSCTEQMCRKTGVLYSLVALDALDVLLANAISVFGLAPRLVVQTTGHDTSARFASGRPEIEMVLGAPVAFVAGHARTTLALAFGVTLQAPRPCKVANRRWVKNQTKMIGTRGKPQNVSHRSGEPWNVRRSSHSTLTDVVALARRTVRVALPLVGVLPAPLAVRPVPVPGAV